MQRRQKKKNRFDISVWVAISATTVLAVILGLMIFAQVQFRKNQAVTLFVEKGATLISSFEAGLSDRISSDEGAFYLQKLLMETARQPDIDYMIVTDNKGNILADSDPSMLGRLYGRDLDTGGMAGSPDIRWRQTANPEGAGTFEVYRRFVPWGEMAVTKDRPPLIVFVGFNMAKIEKASREDAFRTVVMALVLALIGSLAIVSLFLVQAYRLTRASLSRMTVFSEALVKNMPIALLAVDKNGRITACNEQAQGLFASSCPEAVGQEAFRMLPDALSRLLSMVDEKTGLVEQDISLAAKDGEQTWEVVAAAFTDEDAPEGKILLARNVTAIRHMEKEVARSRHLHALGSLAAGVAHEIRNPLSSIKGFALYFKGRLSGHAEDEQTADIMIAETERLNRVVSQLIEFAKPPALEKEMTGMSDLVRHAIRLVNADAQKTFVAIEVHAPEGLPLVAVDADKVKQVLLNILLNAVSAMPDGGRLSIALAARRDFIEVTFSDTGAGIEEEDLPRIYDPYFTSKPAGAGLGLAIVQKIMDAHGGTVQIESKAGLGAKVTLRFPLPVDERMEK